MEFFPSRRLGILWLIGLVIQQQSLSEIRVIQRVVNALGRANEVGEPSIRNIDDEMSFIEDTKRKGAAFPHFPSLGFLQAA